MPLNKDVVLRDAKATPRHHCLIYDGPPLEKIPLLALLIRKNLEDNYRCLYLNSPAMIAGLRSCLSAMGVDVATEITKGSLVLSSEQAKTDTDFDSDQMLSLLEDAVDSALDGGFNGLWVTGDMSWEFGGAKDFKKLLEYEWRLEELFHKREPLRGICQYHRDTLPTQVMRNSLLTHPCIAVNETLSRINPHYLESVFPVGKMTANHALDEVIAELCQTR
ncbi:MAG TPA: MEDS domain-containing protein [Puia sp.]|nr:MEDS domain-containing protein [Puia sp.]